MGQEKEFPIARTLRSQEVDDLKDNLARASAGAPMLVNSSPGSKTYFVAFDGTGNNKNDTDRPISNVGVLYDAARSALLGSGKGLATYYQGPGTQENPIVRSVDALLGTSVLTIATQAYSDYVKWVQAEFAANPQVTIDIAAVSFSRGGGAHTAFLNLVWRLGVPDPNRPGQYLIAPNTANLGANVFFDRVLFGVRQDITELLPDAPASKLRALEIVAVDEQRREFVATPINDETLSDPRVLTLFSWGDHSDIGGPHWLRGIANFNLNSAYAFLSASGVPLGSLGSSFAVSDDALFVHDSYAGMWGRPGGDHVANWIEDRRSKLYFKNNPSPGADTGIDASYRALPTEIADAAWRFGPDGTSVLGTLQQAQNLARQIVPPRGFLAEPASTLAAALTALGTGTRAFIDDRGRINLINDRGGVAVVDAFGTGDILQGAVTQSYRNGALLEVATFKGIANGVATTEVVTANAKSRVYTLDVHGVLTERWYADLSQDVLAQRRITDAAGQCVATDYASDANGSRRVTQTVYEGEFGSRVLSQTVNTLADTNGDGQFDRSDYAQYDGAGRLVGHVMESTALAPTHSASLDTQIEQLQRAISRDDNYVLEVANLRRVVGAQGLNEVWAGTSLLRASDAPEHYVQGFETVQSALLDHADSLWVDGLRPTEWTSLRNNSMTVLEAATTPSAAPGTGWTPTPTSAPATGWTGSVADWFDSARDQAQVSRLGALYAAWGAAFDFEYSASSFENPLNSGAYGAWHGSFGDEWNWGTQHASTTYLPYYNDWSPQFNAPVPAYIDFGFDYSYYAPIALDLDGDGIELLAQAQSNAYFDVKGDGFASHVGWVGPDDAFLAIDLDGNGRIEGAKELSFALWTAAPNDSDLDGLRAVFDTNRDGRISASDAQFSQLRIWQDKNGNGITDSGELRTLTQAGIASLSLTSAATDWASGGNRVRGFTTFTRADGSQGMAADVELGYAGPGWNSSVAGNLVKLTQTGGLAFGLASGATALNVNVTAQGLGGAIGGSGADTLTATGSTAVVLQGGAGNDTLLGGGGDDWLSGGDGIDVLRAGAGDDVLLVDAEDLVSGLDGGAGFDIAVITGDRGVSLDLGPTNLEAAIGGSGHDVLSNSGYGRVILAGGAGNDTLSGGRGNDVLEGGTGNDILRDLQDGSDTYLFARGDGRDTIEDRSFSGQDKLVLQDIVSKEARISREGLDLVIDFGQGDRVTVIKHYDLSLQYRLERVEFADGAAWGVSDLAIEVVNGTPGNDALTQSSTWGRCVYTGGKGNDTFTDTGGGNDTYVFSRGDGQDTIRDEGLRSEADRIVLRDIASSQAKLSRTGVDLVIDLGGTDRITVQKYFDFMGGNKIEQLEFSDGVTWDTSRMDSALTVSGSSTSSTSARTNSLAAFSLLTTASIVIPAAPSSTATPGVATPSNVLESATSVTLGTPHAHLRLTGSAAIDGFGNIYDNTLTGNGAANVLDGGLGNDTLIGGGGNDTYRFARSGGPDRIIENDSTLGNQDTLAFDSSVTHDQLWFSRAANDLQIRIIGTQDTVTVQDWYLGSAYHVEQFRAGDGKLLLDSQVQGLVQAMAQFSPPAVGQITTTTAQQAALMPQLAAAWR